MANNTVNVGTKNNPIHLNALTAVLLTQIRGRVCMALTPEVVALRAHKLLATENAASRPYQQCIVTVTNKGVAAVNRLRKQVYPPYNNR